MCVSWLANCAMISIPPSPFCPLVSFLAQVGGLVLLHAQESITALLLNFDKGKHTLSDSGWTPQLLYIFFHGCLLNTPYLSFSRVLLDRVAADIGEGSLDFPFFFKKWNL